MDFRVGGWVVRPQRRVVECGEKSTHIKPKPMSVLQCLAAAKGAPVSRGELFTAVWPGGEVSEDTLTRCIVELRKAFGDTARDSQVIETIPKLGFRLVPPVEFLEEEYVSAAQSSPENRHSRIGLSAKPNPAGEFALDPYAASHAIAVLPFANVGEDARDEHFSDGITEEILNALANSNRLPVIARTSSFQFKGQVRDIKEIGRLLGVTYVLEGSVRRSGDRVRITTQLIDADTGTHLWSNAYKRHLDDIFDLQEEITHNIVEQVEIVLGEGHVLSHHTAPASATLRSRRTANSDAYDLYLKGTQMLEGTNPAVVEQAVEYFDQAIALDNDYADAWAAKGRALYVLGKSFYGHPHIPATVYPDAIAAFKRALMIESGHAFAMGWLGVALMINDFSWVEGMQLLEQSLSRNPNDAALLSMYGWYMSAMEMPGAEEALDRAYRLDPFGIVPISLRAFSLVLNGRPLDALTVAENSLIGHREAYTPNYYVAAFNLALGRLDAAEVHMRRARKVAHPVDLSLDVMGWAIDSLRGVRPFPWAQLWQRVQTERLTGILHLGLVVSWEDDRAPVRALDIAIEQRHEELSRVLFAPKPPSVPEADWHRIQELTGVTQFRSSR